MMNNPKNQRPGSTEQSRLTVRSGGNAASGQANKTSLRGFASMDPETQRRIASEGGRASHLSGRGHQWTSEEAREAGRKGGRASQKSAPRPHDS